MSQFMADHIQCNGEAVKQPFGYWHILIAVAVYHLLTIPKGVVVTLVIMDSGTKSHSVIIN